MLTIYGKSNCGYCTKAKELAEQYHLKYEYRDIGQFEFLEQMVSMAPKTNTVPQIWWNGRHVGGYNEFATEVSNTIGNYGQGAF